MKNLLIVLAVCASIIGCTSPKDENKKLSEEQLEQDFQELIESSRQLDKKSKLKKLPTQKIETEDVSFSYKELKFSENNLEVLIKLLNTKFDIIFIEADEGYTISAQDALLKGSREEVKSSLISLNKAVKNYLETFQLFDACKSEDCSKLVKEDFNLNLTKYTELLNLTTLEINQMDEYELGELPIEGTVTVQMIQDTVERVERLEEELSEKGIIIRSDILYHSLEKIKKENELEMNMVDLYIMSLDDLVLSLKQVLRISIDEKLILNETTYKFDREGINKIQDNIDQLEEKLKSYRERYIKDLAASSLVEEEQNETN